MIVAVPFFRPLTTPLDVTVATFLLDDLKVIFSSVFFGVAIRFDLLLLSAVAQPLAALPPYGCGTPLANQNKAQYNMTRRTETVIFPLL